MLIYATYLQYTPDKGFVSPGFYGLNVRIEWFDSILDLTDIF